MKAMDDHQWEEEFRRRFQNAETNMDEDERWVEIQKKIRPPRRDRKGWLALLALLLIGTCAYFRTGSGGSLNGGGRSAASPVAQPGTGGIDVAPENHSPAGIFKRPSMGKGALQNDHFKEGANVPKAFPENFPAQDNNKVDKKATPEPPDKKNKTPRVLSGVFVDGTFRSSVKTGYSFKRTGGKSKKTIDPAVSKPVTAAPTILTAPFESANRSGNSSQIIFKTPDAVQNNTSPIVKSGGLDDQKRKQAATPALASRATPPLQNVGSAMGISVLPSLQQERSGRIPLNYYFSFSWIKTGYYLQPDLNDHIYISSIDPNSSKSSQIGGFEFAGGVRQSFNDHFSLSGGLLTSIFSKSVNYNYSDAGGARLLYPQIVGNNQIILQSVAYPLSAAEKQTYWLLGAHIGTEYTFDVAKLGWFVGAGYGWNVLLKDWKEQTQSIDFSIGAAGHGRSIRSRTGTNITFYRNDGPFSSDALRARPFTVGVKWEVIF